MAVFLRNAMFSISLLVIGFTGCTKSPTSSDFSNKLGLGTGLNPANLFQLSGEGTSFTGAPVSIYFRLESKDDMGGSAVRIAIAKMAGSSYVADTSFTFQNPQSYGHIFLSSFTLSTAGSYQATGVLVTGNKTIASKAFTVQ
jgi:hypothetical protein